MALALNFRRHITHTDQDMETNQQLVVWEDVRRHLFDLVRSALDLKPLLTDEKSMDIIISPYLKKIEEEVENKLRQVREDESAKSQEKAQLEYQEERILKLKVKIEESFNLKVGKHSVARHRTGHWIENIDALTESFPQFSQLKLRTEPATSVDFPSDLKWWSDPLDKRFRELRPTITVEGCPDELVGVLQETILWESLIKSLVDRLGARPFHEMAKLEKRIDLPLSKAMNRLEPLLLRRHIQRADLVRFFYDNRNNTTLLSQLAEALELSSICTGQTSKRLDLIQPEQRRTFE